MKRITRAVYVSVVIACTLACTGTAQAQVSLQADVMGAAGFAHTPIQLPAASRYDVVAIRVEFQADSSLFSTGDGTFGGELFPGVEPPKVDPLPHDADYFTAHLDFLENYVRRVSDGRTTVTTHLLPVIVSVPGTMAQYSPIGPDADSDAERTKLARLIEEAWTLASQLDSFDMPDGLDPDRTAFILFHAGVGRDVELLGTTLDKTPEDLPSLYFSSETLERLLPDFNVTVDGIAITNTLLIPRTETRRGVDFIRDQPFLAELSINGMLASSFLSYLGVPDLFNTSTGESAIGPFGVMDGLGIFAYNGLLPPEPSAWTKVYLGWADLQTGNPAPGDQVITLSYGGDASSNDVFLAPVAENEYFLVENRNRDAESDGLNLTVWNDGAYSQVHFDHGDETFNSNTISGFPGGVIVDADNLDFALPGGRGEDGNVLGGGILIWHVDEARLEAGLSSNTVNADPKRRAVDLEEADGAEDLGYPGLGLFGPSFNVGSPFDYFYEGNPTVVITQTGAEIRLYENRFGPDTYPNSASNTGGGSFVELDDFSARGPSMSFVYRRAPENGLTPRDDVSFSLQATDPPLDRLDALYFLDGPAVDFAAFGRDDQGSNVLMWAGDQQTAGEFRTPYDALPVQSDLGLTVLGDDGFYRLGPDGSFQLAASFPPGMDLTRTTTPLVELSNGRIVLGAEDAQGPMVVAAHFGDVTIERTTDPVISLAVVNELREARVFSDRTEIPSINRYWEYDAIGGETMIQAVFAQYSDRSDNFLMGLLPDPESRRLIVLKDDGSTSDIRPDAYAGLGVNGPISPLPILADLDDDRRPDILVTVGNWLLGFNENGTLLDGFPISLRERSDAQPLLVRLVEDGPLIAVVSAVDGRLDAYNLESRTHAVPGFPLSIGTGLAGSPILRGVGLMALSSGGSVSRWDLDAVDEIIWGQSRAQRNNSYAELPAGIFSPVFSEPDVSDRLLTSGETYNWPNPIADGFTWIRFKPKALCDIEITIVDLAGRQIDRIEVRGAPGGISSEVQWRTTAGSGIYLARVTATTDRLHETRLIKMAIIR